MKNLQGRQAGSNDCRLTGQKCGVLRSPQSFKFSSPPLLITAPRTKELDALEITANPSISEPEGSRRGAGYVQGFACGLLLLTIDEYFWVSHRNNRHRCLLSNCTPLKHNTNDEHLVAHPARRNRIFLVLWCPMSKSAVSILWK